MGGGGGAAAIGVDAGAAAAASGSAASGGAGCASALADASALVGADAPATLLLQCARASLVALLQWQEPFAQHFPFARLAESLFEGIVIGSDGSLWKAGCAGCAPDAGAPAG